MGGSSKQYAGENGTFKTKAPKVVFGRKHLLKLYMGIYNLLLFSGIRTVKEKRPLGSRIWETTAAHRHLPNISRLGHLLPKAGR